MRVKLRSPHGAWELMAFGSRICILNGHKGTVVRTVSSQSWDVRFDGFEDVTFLIAADCLDVLPFE